MVLWWWPPCIGLSGATGRVTIEMKGGREGGQPLPLSLRKARRVQSLGMRRMHSDRRSVWRWRGRTGVPGILARRGLDVT